MRFSSPSPSPTVAATLADGAAPDALAAGALAPGWLATGLLGDADEPPLQADRANASVATPVPIDRLFICSSSIRPDRPARRSGSRVDCDREVVLSIPDQPDRPPAQGQRFRRRGPQVLLGDDELGAGIERHDV